MTMDEAGIRNVSIHEKKMLVILFRLYCTDTRLFNLSWYQMQSDLAIRSQVYRHF
jgi:hypothetical protein